MMSCPCRKLVLLAVLLGFPVASAGAQTAAALEDQYRFVLEFSSQMGETLRAEEKALAQAWAELERQGVAIPSERIRDPLVVQMDYGHFRVYFVGLLNEFPKIFYQVEVKDGTIVPDTYAAIPEGADLPARAGLLWASLMTAQDADFRKCAATYSSSVRAYTNVAEQKTGFWVYMIPANDRPGLVRYGGFHRIDVDAEGREVTGSVSYTRTCEDLPITEGPAPYAVRYDGNPFPEEIHVFLSLHHRRIFEVLTTQNGVTWTVDGSSITVKSVPEAAQN